MTIIYFPCIYPSYLDLLLELDRTTAVISTTKQNINTDEKLDLSTDGLLVQRHSTAFRPDTNMTEVIMSA